MKKACEVNLKNVRYYLDNVGADYLKDFDVICVPERKGNLKHAIASYKARSLPEYGKAKIYIHEKTTKNEMRKQGIPSHMLDEIVEDSVLHELGHALYQSDYRVKDMVKEQGVTEEEWAEGFPRYVKDGFDNGDYEKAIQLVKSRFRQTLL